MIVSKPHLVCIKRICKEFDKYKDKILFRFTIGSIDDKVLKFWEPNAPGFEERFACLKYALKHGFHTSVSCEPMLDNHIEKVIYKVNSYVTETIWIGKINRLLGTTGRGNLEFNGHLNSDTKEKALQLIEWQSDENIIKLYESLQNNPKIRWKSSILAILQKHSIKV
jgi:DNA repair photolyase